MPVRHGTSRLFTAPGAPCASTSPGARIPNVSKNVKRLKLWFVQAMWLLVEPVEWDPVLLRNISRQVEHMHMIYIVVYPCIFMYIHGIYNGCSLNMYMSLYIPCIYQVYIWYIHCIFLEYVVSLYIPCIYKVCTMNIPSICRSQWYPLGIPSLVQMGLSSKFFHNDMPRICQVYSMNVFGISKTYHYKKR